MSIETYLEKKEKTKTNYLKTTILTTALTLGTVFYNNTTIGNSNYELTQNTIENTINLDDGKYKIKKTNTKQINFLGRKGGTQDYSKHKPINYRKSDTPSQVVKKLKKIEMPTYRAGSECPDVDKRRYKLKGDGILKKTGNFFKGIVVKEKEPTYRTTRK